MMLTQRCLFGTDGIRGRVNVPPMTAETIIRLARAAASFFTRGSYPRTVVIGKDTRVSGDMIEGALEAAFTSMGFDVILLGTIPLSAVSLLTRSLRANLGVMITGSHGYFPDNGLKLLGPDGYKLSDDVELAIEQRMIVSLPLPNYRNLGKVRTLGDATGRYIEFVKGTFPKTLQLDGLKIVLDCSQGAAYTVAPTIFSELGAHIIPVGVHPDGFNTNVKCGTTDIHLAKKTLIEHKADFAVVLDADADRLVLLDEKGESVNGDQILALIAPYFYEKGKLKGRGIVSTVMANRGLERYLKTLGLALVRSPVGDRYVLASLFQEGMNTGGEPSGHILLHDFSPVADGLITALQVAAILIQSGKPLSVLGNPYEPLPQVTHTLPFGAFMPMESDASKNIIRQAEEMIGHQGVLVVRVSGTEGSLRLMAQSEDESLVHDVIDFLVQSLGENYSASLKEPLFA